ncbi:MAG: nucleoside triphosphate pyrophosphohydrolase [Deltaproteobacteria bacterium]|nr:nucleoside triphosphate pyrophosphohydrolase [Deltaproteobacteria bacterium]
MRDRKKHSFERIAEIIDRLRAPDGCLWDRQQKKGDVGRYLLEEAYEVIDAIEGGKSEALCEELGDVLFQILFLASISEEAGEFDISAVIDRISEKMIRRHPHVFGDTTVESVDEIKSNWEEIKIQGEGKTDRKGSLTYKIPRSLPSLTRAKKITEGASKVGFDWENKEGVLGKIEEELEELKSALGKDGESSIKEEIGDLLFSIVNLCRFTDVEPEEALRSSIAKFINRFAFIEKNLKDEGKTPEEASLEEMDRLWDIAKSRDI